ncbi:unnamed protein product [Chilo suppressalis]|uniref:Uncharacterized protein n=1 Tax=Chilo suppressalis TaxID=168631 RepID=A0ABN8AX19_CHISP|nr:unnamed protein product [Chilo suppressalis]
MTVKFQFFKFFINIKFFYFLSLYTEHSLSTKLLTVDYHRSSIQSDVFNPATCSDCHTSSLY